MHRRQPIYGARGANGVIVITTDSGSKGAPKINFEYRYSLSKDYNRYENDVTL